MTLDCSSSYVKYGTHTLCFSITPDSLTYPRIDYTTLLTSNTNMKPVISFRGLNDDTKYVLIMIDFDAPGSKGTRVPFLHWIVSDLQFKNDKWCSGKEQIRYYPPTPPKGSGEHHYVFYLYQQQKGIQFESLKDRENRYRYNWNIEEYRKQYRLNTLVGLTGFIVKS